MNKDAPNAISLGTPISMKPILITDVEIGRLIPRLSLMWTAEYANMMVTEFDTSTAYMSPRVPRFRSNTNTMVAIKFAIAERVPMMPSILKRNSPCNIELKVRARLSEPNKKGI